MRLSLKQTKLMPNRKRPFIFWGKTIWDWFSIIKERGAKKNYIYNSRGFCTASNRKKKKIEVHTFITFTTSSRSLAK